MNNINNGLDRHNIASEFAGKKPAAKSCPFSPLLDNSEKITHIKGEAKEILNTQFSELPLPKEGLEKIKQSDDWEPQKRAVRLAKSKFDSDPQRAKSKIMAVGLMATFPEMLRSEIENRDRLVDELLNSPINEAVLDENVPPFFSRRNIPAWSALITFMLIFCAALVAEFGNILYLVMNAGLGFEDFYFGAVCFGAIYCIAPFVVAEFLKHGQSLKERHRWAIITKVILLPLVIVGLAVFAWKLGSMENVDAFADPSAQPWEPKLWISLFISMLLLGATVMVLPALMEGPISQLWPYSLRPSQHYEFAAERVRDANHRIAELEGLRARVEGVLKLLKRQRIEFVTKCLAEFHASE